MKEWRGGGMEGGTARENERRLRRGKTKEDDGDGEGSKKNKIKGRMGRQEGGLRGRLRDSGDDDESGYGDLFLGWNERCPCLSLS